MNEYTATPAKTDTSNEGSKDTVEYYQRILQDVADELDAALLALDGLITVQSRTTGTESPLLSAANRALIAAHELVMMDH
jgi:hypothetical protein